MKTKCFINSITVILLFLLLGIGSVVSCGNRERLDDPHSSLCKRAIRIESKSGSGNVFADDYCVSVEDAEVFALMHKQDSEVESIKPFCINEDTLLYVCNYNNRWMIIAGDKRVSPILAQGEEGAFLVEELPKGLHIWLKSMADDIRVMRRYSDEGENEYTRFWSSLARKKAGPKIMTKSEGDSKWYAVDTYVYIDSIGQTVIPHLIQTKWGQASPWNSKLPYDVAVVPPKRCYLGCTATAIGQLLYYTHFHLYKPNHLYHNISCSVTSVYGSTTNIGFLRSDYHSYSTRWNSMALANTDTSSVAISYAGDLMIDIGNRVGMEYSGSGSGAWPSLTSFAYDYNLQCSTGSYNPSIVLTNLQNGIPSIIIAFDSQDSNSGHTWLIDGLYQTTQRYTCYKHFYYGEEWYLYSEYYDTWDDVREQYHHLIQDPSEDYISPWEYTTSYWLMNWGYNGSFDNDHYGLYSAWNVNTHDHLTTRTIYYGFH